MLRGASASGIPVKHCGDTLRQPKHSERLPFLVSRKHKQGLRLAKKRVLREMAKEKADRAAAALLMGIGMRKP